MADPKCSHLDQIKKVTPTGETCGECVKEGTKPVALRLCLSCGNVGCCDSSIGQHARKHFKATNHPIIESFKSATGNGEEWRYCYIDNAYVDSEVAAAK
jgi:uncharacterized UBP type Zn finger protein